jgi:hypothetical protein
MLPRIAVCLLETELRFRSFWVHIHITKSPQSHGYPPLVVFIRELPGSILGPKASYRDRTFRDIRECLQANPGIARFRMFVS